MIRPLLQILWYGGTGWYGRSQPHAVQEIDIVAHRISDRQRPSRSLNLETAFDANVERVDTVIAALDAFQRERTEGDRTVSM